MPIIRSDGFIKDFFFYIKLKFVNTLISILSIIKLSYSGLSKFKSSLVKNLYWGRSSFYRPIIQFMVGLFILLAGFSGISNGLESNNNVKVTNNFSSDYDLLDGFSNTNALIGQNTIDNYSLKTTTYTVKPGEDLTALAKRVLLDEQHLYGNKYVIDDDKLARKSSAIKSLNTLYGSNPSLKAGQELKVYFGFDAITHVVEQNDTLDSIVSKYSANKQDIVDIYENFLYPPYNLVVGSIMYIPKVKFQDLAMPVIAQTEVNYTPSTSTINGLSGFKDHVSSVRWDAPAVKSSLWATGSFINPTGGGVNQTFSAFHPALDLSGTSGLDVHASDGGVVVNAGWYGSVGGYVVIIDHGNGFLSYYGHASQVYVRVGDVVRQSDVIMAVGCTGSCTGPHVHFQISYLGSAVDPSFYIP